MDSMSGVTEEAAGSGGGGGGSGSGGGGGSSGSGGGDGHLSHPRRRFDDKALVARTSLILWHTHQNDAAAVRKLLEEDGALVNARDYDSRTPLHVAALHGWQEVAECLVANGADVNALDRWQNTVRTDALPRILPPLRVVWIHDLLWALRTVLVVIIRFASSSFCLVSGFGLIF
jgi:hypothetical protein